MSFDRIKSFLRTASEITQQPTSILDRTSSFISSSFRRASINNVSTAQFDDYLASLPIIKKLHKKAKSNSANSLKPQLFKRCLENVEKDYFNENYQIDQSFFDKRKKVNQERQSKMHQQLDEIEICLFNQITSRFDEILSVLRTIESLDCLVSENQKKLKSIREGNFKQVIEVSQKQNKMARLIRRKKNIESILQVASKLNSYRKFIELENNIDSPDTVQNYYNFIPTIKENLQIYRKIKTTKNASHRIQQIQATIKRSFSDKVNEKIFQYIKKDIPYQTQFWKKHINYRNILQQKQQKDNSTLLLDQSTIITQQQSVSTVLAKKQDNVEILIVQFIKNGWRDGEYSFLKLKNQVDVLLKSKHNAFMLDFRNFCDEVCKKYMREVDNPSLTNLLKQISITFCTKVYNYFFDIHKSIILRFFSLSRKVYQFLIAFKDQNLSIDQKDKINLIAEGFANNGSHLIRIILQKLVDIQETKIIHEAIDISEIKQAIGVLQNTQSFLEKQIQMVVTIPQSQNSFLAQFFQILPERYPIKILQIAKKRKLLDYLNKIHKNSLTVELKQSLQNQTWVATDIPTFYYDSLHYLITGESLNLRRNKQNLKNQKNSMMFETSVLMDGQKGQQSFMHETTTQMIGNFRIIRNDITINGKNYKVTQTLLLLLQMLQDYMTLAQNFPVIKPQVGSKINELIRSYNVSSCQLIVYAGAIALQKIKSKMITSRHLALSSLCLKFILYIMECIEKRIQVLDADKLRQTVEEHFDIIIKKLNQIIIFKANSAKIDINLKNTPSKGTQTIVSSAKILLQILSEYYDKQILGKIFTVQFLNIYLDAISNLGVTNRVQAQALKDDVNFYFSELKALGELGSDFEVCRITAEDVVRKAFEQL